MKRVVLILTSIACTGSVWYTAVRAQAPASASQGVYTAAQATRGAALYAEQCAFCHGEKLEGSGAMPPLTGPDFAKNWTGKTLGDLFEKTHGTMPATAPGTLTEQQTADVLAYMLQVSQYPAGTAEIVANVESLKAITLDAPPAGAGAPAAGSAAVPGGAVAGGAVAGAAASPAGAGVTVAHGVYTVAQAQRGATLYVEQCAGCHGEKLEGAGAMPPLAGPDFASNWNGRTLGELFEKTHGTMPATAPGSLTEQQTADVLAYILQVAQYPAGTSELAPNAEPLKAITFVAP